MTLEEAAKVNIIPPVEYPNGTLEEQPDAKNIILDDDYALMSKDVFDRLPDHSCLNPRSEPARNFFDRHAEYTNAIPAEKYNGRMWKTALCKMGGPVWVLGWCHNKDLKTNTIFTSYREILIID